MGRFIPRVLVHSDELSQHLRWRLVENLFSQYRAMIDGSLALAFVEGIGAYQTGATGFLLLLAAVVLVTAARAGLTIAFFRRAGPTSNSLSRPRRSGTPERWAWRFVAGNAATAGLFGATALYVCLGFHNPTLQLFVILVQGAWIAGSTQRNAVSPAAVTIQTTLVSVPTIIGAAFSGTGLVQWVILFVVAHAFSARSALRYFSALYLDALLTEQRLASANARLTLLSSTDGLTGVGNRRAFDAAFQAEAGRAARDGRDLSLIMIDVDHFKHYNDHYGHPAGDDCLRQIASLIDSATRGPPAARAGDFVARFGGEEFAAVLPGASAAYAYEVAERIRQAVLDAALPHAASPAGVVTVSLGLASLAHCPGGDAQTLLTQADEALYRAKQAGRNRIGESAISFQSSESLPSDD